MVGLTWEPSLRGAVDWDDDVETILHGDLTAAAAYVTPLGGTVVTSVAPCGLASRADGTVGFTTSLGIGKKLEHILRDPRVALAYHTREHGSAVSPSFVLVQGHAFVDLAPSRQRLERFIPQAEQFLGPVKQGVLWDRLMHEYYFERVFVDIAVERILIWNNLSAAGEPTHVGSPPPPMEPASQAPPANGTAPRVDCARLVKRLAKLPHRLVGFRGSDGFPVVLPVDFAGHDEMGLRLVSSSSLPPGNRRAGLLAHAFRPELVGLTTRTGTGWLEVDGHQIVYSPHTSKGFTAVPNKTLLLAANGILAKVGLHQARRCGTQTALTEAQRSGRDPRNTATQGGMVR